MAKFSTIEERIELNEKSLSFFYSNYEQMLGKVSVLSIIYTAISIYIIQLVSLGIAKKFSEFFVFDILIAIVLILVVLSIYFAIRFLIPVNIAYTNLPTYFYNNIRNKYIDMFDKEGTKYDDTVLEIYVQATYLSEIERAVKTNFDIYQKKRQYYYTSFLLALTSIIPYIICIGMFLGEPKKDEVHKVEITNNCKLGNDMCNPKTVGDTINCIRRDTNTITRSCHGKR